MVLFCELMQFNLLRCIKVKMQSINSFYLLCYLFFYKSFLPQRGSVQCQCPTNIGKYSPLVDIHGTTTSDPNRGCFFLPSVQQEVHCWSVRKSKHDTFLFFSKCSCFCSTFLLGKFGFFYFFFSHAVSCNFSKS